MKNLKNLSAGGLLSVSLVFLAACENEPQQKPDHNVQEADNDKPRIEILLPEKPQQSTEDSPVKAIDHDAGRKISHALLSHESLTHAPEKRSAENIGECFDLAVDYAVEKRPGEYVTKCMDNDEVVARFTCLSSPPENQETGQYVYCSRPDRVPILKLGR